MKVILYGAEICPGCRAAKARLSDVPGVELEFRNITESTALLREFLHFRDHDPLFAPIVEVGRIGIPFFVLEDGTETFDMDDFVAPDGTLRKNACSLDGKGC